MLRVFDWTTDRFADVLGDRRGADRSGAGADHGSPVTQLPAVVYAVDDSATATPADAWFWQRGDRWMAVVAGWHEDWWEDCDPEDLAGRPDPWRRPIEDRPANATLIYRTGAGRIAETPA